MAAKGEEVLLSFKADLGDLRSELSKLPGITDKEAGDMVKSLERQLKKAEKAAKASAKATRKAAADSAKAQRAAARATDQAGQSLENFKDTTGEADSILQAFAGGLDTIDPKLGGFVRVLGDGAGVLEAVARTGGGLVAIVGPLAAAAGLAALAWSHFSDELEESEEKISAAREELEAIQKIVGSIEQETLTAELERQVATGEASVEVLEARNAQLKAEGVFAAAIEQAEIKRGKALDKVRKTQDDITAATRSAGFGATEKTRELEAALAGAQGEAQAAQNQIDGLEAKTANLAATYLETASAKRQETKQTKKDTEAKRDSSKAAREREKLEKDEIRRLEKLAAARESSAKSLESLTSSTVKDRLEGIDAIVAAEAAALDREREIFFERLALAEENEEEIARVYREHTAARADLEEEFSLRYLELAEERAQKEAEIAAENDKRIAQQRRQLLEQSARDAIALADMVASWEYNRRTETISAIQEALEDSEAAMTDAKRKELEARLAAEQKAALRAFRAQQAIALAEIAMNTAGAIMKALQQYGIPWGFIPAGIASAMGTASAAIVLAQKPPKFHVGGMVGSGGPSQPDEVDARLRTGEGVLNTTAMSRLGQSGLDALNRGDGGGAPIVVVQRYGHQVFDRFMDDHLRLPGAALRKKIKGSTRVGHG